jgi:hypothetical protein
MCVLLAGGGEQAICEAVRGAAAAQVHAGEASGQVSCTAHAAWREYYAFLTGNSHGALLKIVPIRLHSHSAASVTTVRLSIISAGGVLSAAPDQSAVKVTARCESAFACLPGVPAAAL